ncbi:MAG TPA: hydrogenase maturation nickel metallochaperone HypA [Patescibacteria group bacterium]|nr:hydrogenase maturation nickel metallochaperone HypA [Patescibacteria group bacterium]
MHEMSLTEGIIRVLEDQAAAQGYARVKTVWLEIGELSTVDPDSLRFCFEAIRNGTIAAEAVLDVIRLPGQAYCMDCAKPVHVAQRYDDCPDCGGASLQIIGGDEMRIKELEVE